MPRQSTTYDILIASPSDTTTERDVISRCIRDWSSAHAQIGIHCRDVRWELDAVPAYGERTQDELNMQLVDSSDILIGVFKARIGTPAGISSSWTIEEIDRFAASGNRSCCTSVLGQFRATTMKSSGGFSKLTKARFPEGRSIVFSETKTTCGSRFLIVSLP